MLIKEFGLMDVRGMRVPHLYYTWFIPSKCCYNCFLYWRMHSFLRHEPVSSALSFVWVSSIFSSYPYQLFQECYLCSYLTWFILRCRNPGSLRFCCSVSFETLLLALRSVYKKTLHFHRLHYVFEKNWRLNIFD